MLAQREHRLLSGIHLQQRAIAGVLDDSPHALEVDRVGAMRFEKAMPTQALLQLHAARRW